jgi:hypothetical protein
MGFANPFLMASTPAMKVVVTAPIPTHNTPSLPFAGAMSAPFSTIVNTPKFNSRIEKDGEV